MYWGLLNYPCQDHKPQVTEMYPHINQISILNPYHFSITRVHKLQNNSWTVIQCCSSLLDSSFSTSVNNVFLPLSGAGRYTETAAATAKLFQSCPTLYDLIDSSPPGSSVPGILLARTLEWVAMSFSNAWKWRVKVNSLSRVRLLATPWTATYQAPPPMRFSRQEYWSESPLPSPILRLDFC